VGEAKRTMGEAKRDAKGSGGLPYVGDCNFISALP
jgi:hypothetical protein